MSEFEKLMKSGGSTRATIKQRNQDRAKTRQILWICLGLSFILCFMNIGWILLFITLLIGVSIYQGREWMG